MANMSAAEVLKAEMSGLSPVKPDRSLPIKPLPAVSITVSPPATLEASPMSDSPPIRNFVPGVLDDDSDDVPGFGNHRNGVALPLADVLMKAPPMDNDVDADGEPDPDALPMNEGTDEVERVAGIKRKFDEGPAVGDADDEVTVEDDDDAVEGPLALKVNSDGTVEQADTVKFVSKFKLVIMS
jgi:5'-3' exoribonuclease 2